MNSGEKYKKRLQDGRNVWLNGKKVQNLVEHPSFKGTISTISSLLDLQKHPDVQEELTFETPNGNRTNMAFLFPQQKEDIFRRSRAFRLWSGATFGVMSRVASFYRSQLLGWYLTRDHHKEIPGYSEKMKNYFEWVMDNDLLITAAGHDPQIDRSKNATEHGDDIYTAARIVGETEEGMIIRGAKMISTGAPYMDEIMISSHKKRTEQEKGYGAMFAISANTPNVHLICRESFASNLKEDYPLSYRFDEMDAVIVFDDALIPWERVFIKDDAEAMWKIRNDPFTTAISLHETIVRLISKLEFVAAIGNDLAESIGVHQYQHVQAKLAELFMQVETIQALLLSAEHQSKEYGGVWAPDVNPMVTAKNLGMKYYPRAIGILQQISAAGMLQTPSRLEELKGEIGPFLQKYYRGADRDAQERIQLLKLSWDLVGSPLGSRHELYERFYAGDSVRAFAAQYLEYDKRHLYDKVQSRLTSTLLV
ncbi:4-hydroxyphenylacetate 3-hydroxylase [Peribacillus asahii]|uniref:4-hydroxyphenylacetate 3-hydroxylase n=1 Tax=Peribacillus asahii TaxID=228899 RepID=A0A398BNY3_9BACI|nr:4-hydroxyphenylacetate 3-hydroxylase N-terminal domain-containing protein [Peribacillus asahii]RID89056.1 4-hydroxyphenylacetate 3-hydroxylase [Peribacillus asahii]